MKAIEIIKGLDKKELLKLESDVKSILNELNWKLTKAARALHLHYSAIEECTEKLQANRQRMEETRLALQIFSETHPLRNKCEDDLYKTEIRVFRLENKLKRFSSLKQIQLEVKKVIVSEEIKYYEGLLNSISDLFNPPIMLRNTVSSTEKPTKKNPQSNDESVYSLRGNEIKAKYPAVHKRTIHTEKWLEVCIEEETLQEFFSIAS